MSKRTRAITRIQTALIIVIIVVALAAGVLYSQYSTSRAPPASEIKIGLVLPLTGIYSPFGQDMLKAIQVTTDMFQQKGGISGVKVTLVTGDSASSTSTAVSEAARLISVEHVNLLVGSYAGPLALAVSSVAERQKVPFFELIAAPNQLTTNTTHRWTFRFGPSGTYYGYAAVETLVNAIAPAMGVNPQNFTIAIVHEDGSYGTSCADGDQARASYYHLNVVDREPYSSASSDLSALVTKLKQVNPDVILITSYAADAQLFIRQSHELGLAPKVIIGHSGGWELPSTASALGPNIVGIFAVGTPVYAMNLTGLDPQVRSDFTQFTQQYQNRFNAIPAGWGIKSFTSTYHVLYKSVLPTAITKYGGVDPESIRKAFLDVNIPVGGTVVGYGVKFAAPETNDPGDNILATSHPVAEWFNSTQQGLVVVYPRNLALKQPDVTLYKPKGSSSVSSVQPITGTVYAPSGSREFQIVSLNPVPPLVSRYAAWDATSPS